MSQISQTQPLPVRQQAVQIGLRLQTEGARLRQMSRDIGKDIVVANLGPGCENLPMSLLWTARGFQKASGPSHKPATLQEVAEAIANHLTPREITSADSLFRFISDELREEAIGDRVGN